MGWLRLVGSLKLQVSFAEYRVFNRAILQKRPIILRSLFLEATLYLQVCMSTCECVCVFVKAWDVCDVAGESEGGCGFGVCVTRCLCICVGGHIHIHIYIYMYLHVYIHVFMYTHTNKYIYTYMYVCWYGVATVSRIDKITGLFCRIWSLS